MKKIFLFLLALPLCLSAGAKGYKTQSDISYYDHRPDTLKILAIGNSFSEDAVEGNLWEMLNAAGIPAVIGNMYIGGCTLERHWNNAKNDAPEYRYRKIVGGKTIESYGVKLSTALSDEAWTHVSFQQASGLSGLYASYDPYLTELLDYAAARVPEGTVHMFHQTWSYSNGSNHPEFPVYGCSQMTMYNRIVNAVRETLADHPQVSFLIPSGTTIQNARTSAMGDVFNRDGFHLEFNFGRFAAACAWYAAITGNLASDNPWKPSTISEQTAAICRKAADLAVAKPFEVTDISAPLPAAPNAYRQERCKLDIYYPTGVKRFKTIVWFHGGGLTGGDKEIPEQLRKQGIAVVSAAYRLSPKATSPSYIQDAAAALAWTFRHIAEYGGDPSQIYVSGHSAGGYLALMLLLDKRWLAAEGLNADSVRAYYPISGQTATHYTIRQERGASFTTPMVDRMAPLGNVRKLGTRLVLFTGERSLELMARFEENLYLKAVLEGIGNPAIPLYEFNGADHGTVLNPAFEHILSDMRAH